MFGDSVSRNNFVALTRLLQKISDQTGVPFYTATNPSYNSHNVALLGENGEITFTYSLYFLHHKNFRRDPSTPLPIRSYLIPFLNSSLQNSTEISSKLDIKTLLNKTLNLTLVSIGSHDTDIASKLQEEILPDFFKALQDHGYNRLQFNLITAIKETIIPQKFGPQELCRNNKRVKQLNEATIGYSRLRDEEVNDLFSVSYSGLLAKGVYLDAIHASHEAAEYLEQITMLRAFNSIESENLKSEVQVGHGDFFSDVIEEVLEGSLPRGNISP